MANIQCKMCGGELFLPEGVQCGTCEYCGSLMTFPKISNEQMENLYNRAEYFRRLNDYDKAVTAYEKVIDANPDDPEAYWGLVLSRFGIEYVEDPLTHERIPTCHRVSYDSILADADYLAALERAGGFEKEIYEREAQRIAEIQKGILAISNQEEPFDVFICYKENDNGRRTKDSVVAQDIYYALQQEGLKVFFARITLESKLGHQYEPYIFAALNSAKAMLVIGSKAEYFNAVWVRNEWSRYLALMKRDRSKLLIPCYKDMDAYDIPEELSMFQAQDMGKIGFIQDIIRGLKKIAGKSEVKAAETSSAVDKAATMRRRVEIALESGDFSAAYGYCEKLLDDDPENGTLYLYKAMAELEVSEPLKLINRDFKRNTNFQLAVRFADDELKSLLYDIEKNPIVERCVAEKELNESLKRLSLLKRYLNYARFLRFKRDFVQCLEFSIVAEQRLLDSKTFLGETVQETREYSLKVIEQAKRKIFIEFIIRVILGLFFVGLFFGFKW